MFIINKHTLLLRIFTFILTLDMASVGYADQPPYRRGQFQVENVWATPDERGGNIILRFRIVNEGKNHIRLVGIKTAVAEEARIIGKSANREPVIYNSIMIRTDSDLNLATHHLWVELGTLSRTISAGETFPLDLIFLNEQLSVDVHVHDIKN